MAQDRHGSTGSSANRFPTVQEDDAEDLELSHIPWRAQTTSAIPSPPLRSNREGSTGSIPSPSSRAREGSTTSLPSYVRRDSVAPSQMGSARRKSRTPSVGATPMSEDSGRTLEGGQPSSSEGEDTEEDAVGTEDKLKDFHKVEASNLSVDEATLERKREAQRQYAAARSKHQPTLQALREWARYHEQTPDLLLGDVRQAVGLRRGPRLPSDDKLIALAHHYFKPMAEIKIQVCDFGDGNAKHFTATLDEIQHLWNNKPEWATVRWIHAPLGLGLKHSSVEDLFLHAGPTAGKPFSEGGSHGWPYLTSRVLSLRSREQFKEMRDVCVLMKTKLPHISDQLNKTMFEGDDMEALEKDIRWRGNHVGQHVNFWNLAQNDISYQLSESSGMGQGMDGPHSGLKPVDCAVDEQMLSKHPFYAESQLVNDPFRCFHRSDGCLLTLSPIAGINYLERRHKEFLREPPEGIFENKDAFALSQVWQAFSKTGTKTWHRNTVEWFLVYLMTEIETTPHNISQGHNAPALQQAYQTIIADLKRRRFDQWKRYESINLVRDYISCVDELTIVTDVYARKLDFFARLRKDCERLEAEDPEGPNNIHGKTATARVDWAIGVVEETYQAFNGMLIDLKSSMSALFQLRSIEQNELAIVADSQNRAILVFTGVTIVFLPLSFFTSYFGMNLKGIQDTNRGEGYFWAVCGTIGFILVFVTVLLAFRHKLAEAIRQRTERRRIEHIV